MAAFAGAIDICCDGCGIRLSEDSEVYCLGCRTSATPKERDLLIRAEIDEIRAGMDMLIDCGLIAPVGVRDQLAALSSRLGVLTG
jgi:hypothetical protein